MEARLRNSSPSLAELVSVLKPGIVASNSFTSVAGFALASALGPGRPIEAGFAALGLGFAVTLFGTAGLVAGSCAVNNWIDRDIDASMARTKDRPTATGRMGAAWTLGLGFGLIVAGALLLGFLSGPVPALVGLAGSLAYILPYSLWSKRRGGWSSLVGGVSGAIPPLIGWTVVDPGFGGPALLLFAFLVVWQQAHVRALALKREGDYRRAAVPMAGLGDEAVGSIGGRRRWLLLAWIALLLPLPLVLAWQVGGAAAWIFGGAESLACALWLLGGLLGSRPSRGAYSGAWGRLMFFASLGYLVFFFAGLLVLALVGVGG